MSQRLDHGRPLWRFDLVGPLADGREAIVCRIHHAMADGISSVRFLREVLWDESEPSRGRGARPAGRGAAGALTGGCASSRGCRARSPASSATAPRTRSSTGGSARRASSPSRPSRSSELKAIGGVAARAT